MLLSAAIIGRLGTAPLGAVGLSTLIFVFSNLFFNFLTVCTTSTVAIAAADKDTAEVQYMFSELTDSMSSRSNVLVIVCHTGR